MFLIQLKFLINAANAGQFMDGLDVGLLLVLRSNKSLLTENCATWKTIASIFAMRVVLNK